MSFGRQLIRRFSSAQPTSRRFDGKSVIVTGGANGIGAAITSQLYLEGALVTIADLDADGAHRTMSSLTPAPGLHAPIFVKTRVNVEAESVKLIQHAKRHWGHIDGLVNNAVSFVVR